MAGRKASSQGQVLSACSRGFETEKSTFSFTLDCKLIQQWLDRLYTVVRVSSRYVTLGARPEVTTDGKHVAEGPVKLFQDY